MSAPNPITPSKDTDKEASSSWSSRIPLSTPPLPSFRPNMAGLRTALLGYLGEVERALQGQVQTAEEVSGSDKEWTSSCDSTADETDDEARGRTSAVASTSTSASSSGLRQRGAPTVSEPVSTALNETNMSLLNHLSALREDVRAYLHSVGPPISMSVPSMPQGGREWLRSLPSKLSVVDIGVDTSSPVDMVGIGKGKGRLPNIDLGAVTNARRRVLKTVRTLLPSEEWAGWERLGWEDQEEEEGDLPVGTKGRRRTLSASVYRDLPTGEQDDQEAEQEEEEGEPEYLFPNRTPASQQAMAIATRRRAIRSTSFSAALLSRRQGDDEEEEEDERPGSKAKYPGFLSAPLSRRTTGLPAAGAGAGEGADEDEDGLDGMSGTLQEKLELAELRKLVAETDVGPTLSEALRRAEDGNKLITYADLPFWWRNNEHIITGYRFIPLHAKTGPIPLIKSAFAWHNETVNIHSHFIPTILIICAIPFVLYTSPLSDPHPLDTYIVALYLLAAVSCLSSSAGWHVLAGCASKKWFEWGACVDYIGIAWLIAASFGTVAYNGFYCQPKSVLFFCSTNALCGALGSYLPFQRWFNERKYKNWRIAFFLFLNFAMIAPMVQLFYQHGYEKGSAFVAPFGLSVITYVVGLLFYAFHIPECIYPGRFDIWGNSHQVWHAAIVGAIILHYRAVFVAHGQRYNYSCAMPDAGQPVGEAWDDLWRQAALALGA